MPPKKQPKQPTPVDDKAVAQNATAPPDDKTKAAPATKQKQNKSTTKDIANTRNCSIQVGSEVIATIAGPIHEWLPVPENLPKHPTMAYFGKRRTGKSTTITNVLFHCCQGIPFGLVVKTSPFLICLLFTLVLLRR